MTGYDPDFLGAVHLPLPDFSPAIEQDILRDIDLTQEYIADYLHYSLVMNGDPHRRSAAFVALNINQNDFKSTRRRDNWRIDQRVGADNQLNNDYYRNNEWDRGHMARRSTAAHGETQWQAQRASDETFYYTNCCLQHANLNQDE